LKYGTGREKVILDELEELALINGQGLEHVRLRCGHVEEDEGLSEEWIAGARKNKMATTANVLGFEILMTSGSQWLLETVYWISQNKIRI
jgi:hypothetical protein